MSKIASIIRITILFVLFAFAIVLLFGEEQDESMADLLLHIVVDKSLGLALYFLITFLYKRWRRIDLILMACDKMCNECNGED